MSGFTYITYSMLIKIQVSIFFAGYSELLICKLVHRDSIPSGWSLVAKLIAVMILFLTAKLLSLHF